MYHHICRRQSAHALQAYGIPSTQSRAAFDLAAANPRPVRRRITRLFRNKPRERPRK